MLYCLVCTKLYILIRSLHVSYLIDIYIYIYKFDIYSIYSYFYCKTKQRAIMLCYEKLTTELSLV